MKIHVLIVNKSDIKKRMAIRKRMLWEVRSTVTQLKKKSERTLYLLWFLNHLTQNDKIYNVEIIIAICL